jgi:hypothetical protein
MTLGVDGIMTIIVIIIILIVILCRSFSNRLLPFL